MDEVANISPPRRLLYDDPSTVQAHDIDMLLAEVAASRHPLASARRGVKAILRSRRVDLLWPFVRASEEVTGLGRRLRQELAPLFNARDPAWDAARATVLRLGRDGSAETVGKAASRLVYAGALFAAYDLVAGHRGILGPVGSRELLLRIARQGGDHFEEARLLGANAGPELLATLDLARVQRAALEPGQEWWRVGDHLPSIALAYEIGRSGDWATPAERTTANVLASAGRFADALRTARGAAAAHPDDQDVSSVARQT